MSATADILEKVVPPRISSDILSRGYDHVGGYVVRAQDVAGLSPAQLTTEWALTYPGSPFPAQPEHLDVLRFRRHACMTLREPGPMDPRPWPTYSDGFLLGTSSTPVWSLERTRLPVAAELWRTTGSEEIQLATFEGAARGWRGSRGYQRPTDFVGTRALWHDHDLPAELSRDGATVELIAVGRAAPDGFDEVRPDVWRRSVPRSEVDCVFEPVLTCSYRDVPCRILQHTGDRSHLLLLSDHPENSSWLGAAEVDVGSYEVVAPTAELTNLRRVRVDCRSGDNLR
jgi:hypothetical protein